MQPTRFLASLALTTLALSACAPEAAPPTMLERPSFAIASVNPATAASMLAVLDQANAGLSASGSGYRVALAEYITDAGSAEIGATILRKDVGNKRLGEDFVAHDTRREEWSGIGPDDDITFAIDQTLDAIPLSTSVVPITAAEATAAIRRAMATWDNVACATLPITEVSAGTTDLGIVAFQNGLGGSGALVADIQQAGFRDINFAPGVLGVTFTFIFVDDDTGEPTDVDNNGRADVAFREIYYDPSWIWRVDGGNIDIETVAVHESGHGLSRDHFGNIYERHNGLLDASPRAIMNAVYQAPLRELLGSDNAGHCGDWAAWQDH